jgi:PIN domain nuclease of toxin-antitoxin system
MQILLDTNVLIWLYNDDRRLSKAVVQRLRRGDDEAFISVVSGWEYGQKRLKWPGQLAVSFDVLIASVPHEPLALEFDVHRFSESLPLIHRDPFDRMLIAQAIYHDLTLIASDEKMRRYPVKTLW